MERRLSSSVQPPTLAMASLTGFVLGYASVWGSCITDLVLLVTLREWFFRGRGGMLFQPMILSLFQHKGGSCECQFGVCYAFPRTMFFKQQNCIASVDQALHGNPFHVMNGFVHVQCMLLE